MNKITVIGSGSVGSTVAYTLVAKGIASEIVMIDINEKKAMGEALDIRQGLPFCNPTKVYAGSFADAKGSDIVVITSGIPRKAGQSRLELAQTNVNMLKGLAANVTKYAPDATYVLVSNPVDILTYAFHKYTDIPEERIIGSGTILDTARLRARIAEYYNISQKNVHAYVLGEHGDSCFIPWSLANVSNVPTQDFGACTKPLGNANVAYPDFVQSEIEEYVRKSGASVISRKGATFYAVSMSVCHICESLLSGIDTTMTVSTMMHGEYGVDDVCLSLLNIVGEKGAHTKVLLPMNDTEITALHNSANCLKGIINSIEF